MKRHIRNFARTWHSESATIAYWRCGNQIDWSKYQIQLFTPLASDSLGFMKKHNVCLNCVRNFYGKRRYIQEKGGK